MAGNLFGSLRSVFLTKIGAVTVDVSLSQNHRFPSKITENPVEEGTVYTDHVVLLPVVLEIDGRITDSPISLLGTFTQKYSVQDAFRELIRIQKAREPVPVVTGLNVYENMLIEEISFPRAAGDGNSVRFSAILREIQIIGKDIPTNRERVAENVRHTALPIANNGFVSRIFS